MNIPRPLSDDLTTEKIAQIRAKLISNRRTKIVRPDEEESRTQSMVMGDLEVKANKLLFCKVASMHQIRKVDVFKQLNTFLKF